MASSSLDRLLDLLLARPELAGECPSVDRLAAYVDRGSDDTAPEVESHLSRCRDCRTLVAGLVRAQRPSDIIRFPAARPLLGAAGLLLVVIAGFALSRLLGSKGGTEERLLAAGARLAGRHPDTFTGFHPYRAGELRPSGRELRGGGPKLQYPSRTILEARPSFRWQGLPGVAAWEVTILTAAGATIWSAATEDASLEYPPMQEALSPGGRYSWRVEGGTPLGTVEGRGSFQVASHEASMKFRSGLRAIREEASPPLRDLLEAHWAIRHDLYGAAEQAARRFHEARPGDRLGRETLACVLGHLGMPLPPGLLAEHP